METTCASASGLFFASSGNTQNVSLSASDFRTALNASTASSDESIGFRGSFRQAYPRLANSKAAVSSSNFTRPNPSIFLAGFLLLYSATPLFKEL